MFEELKIKYFQKYKTIDRSRVGLETAMAPTVNRGWHLFTNGKYLKSFSKLFHIIQRLRLVFQLNDCVVSKDINTILIRI